MILPALIIYIIFYFYPLIKLLPQSVIENGEFTLKYLKRVFTETLYIGTLLRTIWISVTATLITLFLGYGVAYTLLQINPKLANVILAIILISMWTSLLVRTYSWMVLLQRTGIINQILLRMKIISVHNQIH